MRWIGSSWGSMEFPDARNLVRISIRRSGVKI